MTGEDNENKAFRLLGILDVQNTPCARDAILHGAGGSLAAGLLHFLATSRVRRSFDVGFAGFVLTTLGSWFYCRMNNAKLRVQQRIIQDGIRNKVAYEGTVLDPTNRPPAESIRALVTSGTETPPKSPPPLTSSPQDGRT